MLLVSIENRLRSFYGLLFKPWHTEARRGESLRRARYWHRWRHWFSYAAVCFLFSTNSPDPHAVDWTIQLCGSVELPGDAENHFPFDG